MKEQRIKELTCTFQKCQRHERQGKADKNCSRLKEAKQTQQPNSVLDPGLRPALEENEIL